MELKLIQCEIVDGIATVTINRPDKMNALNAAVLGELACCFDALKSDASARGVIVTGAGEKAFVAGADIAAMKDLDEAGAKVFAAAGHAALAAIEALHVPAIAAVNGFALGGGCELALACTLRTASKTAKIGLPEVSLGIIPGYGGTQRLARIAGPGVAREWVLTGDMVTAEEAWRVGVVNRLFEPSELKEGTTKLMKTILSRAPIALRLAMETIRRGQNMSQQEGEIIETDMFGLAAATADMKEGMSAFLQKRKAEFKNQ